MHGSPNWTRIACVLAERSRSAPQALGARARDGRHCPLSHLARATAQARPSPRARDCSQPPTVCISYNIVVGSCPTRTVALVVIP
eukprot:576583-Pleurochrysis_carterae.AAC.1